MPKRRGLRRTLICFAVAVALGAATWGVAAALPRPLHTVSLTASTADIQNPERGWYDAADLTDPGSVRKAHADGVTIVHTYLRLDAYRESALPATFLTSVDHGFAAVRAAHLKVVLRVAYNFDGSGPDAPLSVIQAQAAQLKPLLARNRDVVFSFEAGFIGAWGEWHDSTNGLATPEAKGVVLRSVLAAFPKDRSVALRYPDDIRALLPKQVTDATAYTGSAAARVGNHEDCFLSSVPDDGGTWGQHGGSVSKDKALIASLGRYTVVGGEMCATSGRTTCPTALNQLSTLHFSYLNREFDAGALQKLQDGGCSGQIGQRLGYRLSLTDFGWTQQVGPGGTLSVQLDVRNAGFAHVVNARPVFIVLRKGSTTVRLSLRTNIRAWAAGSTTSVREDVRLPPSVTTGSWSMSLWMPDAATLLRPVPAYSIRF